MTSKPDEKIILTSTSSFDKLPLPVEKKFSDLKLRIEFNPYDRKLSGAEISDLLKQHRPIGLLAGTEKIGRSTLENAKDYLKVISRVVQRAY